VLAYSIDRVTAAFRGAEMKITDDDRRRLLEGGQQLLHLPQGTGRPHTVVVELQIGSQCIAHRSVIFDEQHVLSFAVRCDAASF
jgi:hypothetical protein